MKTNSRFKNMLLSALVAVIYVPINANAVFITTSVGDFEVTTIETAYDPLSDVFTSQVWWGNVTLAEEFANLTNTVFGTPNLGIYSPFFWYTDNDTTGPCFGSGEPHAGVFWNQSSSAAVPVCAGTPPSAHYTFAVAERVFVPEPPVLLLMGLGLAGIGLTRIRRRAPIAWDA